MRKEERGLCMLYKKRTRKRRRRERGRRPLTTRADAVQAAGRKARGLWGGSGDDWPVQEHTVKIHGPMLLTVTREGG
jgi:hypothetical protein